MTFERRTDKEPNPYESAPVQLSPKTAQEAILFMLKGFGEYPDEIRIAVYLDVLGDLAPDDIWQSVKQWMKQPNDRAAKPGELRALINLERAHKEEIEHRQRQAVTEQSDPTSASRLDEYYAELLKEQPDNLLLKQRIAERARARAKGTPLNGQAEVDAILHVIRNGKEVR